MKKTITCRPCKEQNNWEIKDQNGNVLNEHLLFPFNIFLYLTIFV